MNAKPTWERRKCGEKGENPGLREVFFFGGENLQKIPSDCDDG